MSDTGSDAETQQQPQPKQKRPCTQEQLERLAQMRAKAVIVRRQLAQERQAMAAARKVVDLKQEAEQRLQLLSDAVGAPVKPGKPTVPLRKAPVRPQRSSSEFDTDTDTNTDTEAPLPRVRGRSTSGMRGKLEALEKQVLKLKYKARYAEQAGKTQQQQPVFVQAGPTKAPVAPEITEAIKKLHQPRQESSGIFGHLMGRLF